MAEKHHFLQRSVQTIGSWWVASHTPLASESFHYFVQRRIKIGFAVFGTLVALLVASASSLYAATTSVITRDANADASPLLCRFGVNASHLNGEKITDFDLAALRTGWYIDYHAQATAARPNGIEYTPMIRLKQQSTTTYSYSPSGNELNAAIAAHPGAVWFIGNEPDRKIYQDDMLPELYAVAYQDLYFLIKQKDPTARIFAGSIVQPTPLRLQYLDKILQSYLAKYGQPMPVDGWSIHNFILNEASCDHYESDMCWGAEIPPGISAIDGLRITVDDNDRFDLFVEQIVRFRQWMAARGYRNTPLYLSEYGVLMPSNYGFPASRVNLFMTKTFDYMLNTTHASLGFSADGNRLVQRFSWYSTADYLNFNGYLFEPTDPGYRLSAMGQNYAAYTKNISDSVDIKVVSLQVNPAAPPVGSAPVTITLRAEIANSGNFLSEKSVTVRFYDGDPTQDGQPIGDDQTVSLNGCGDSAIAQVIWPNVAENQYAIYVVADPENEVSEAGEGKANNSQQTTVFFSTNSIYLPVVSNSISLGQ